MRFSAYHILRVGIGITFIWLGILIFQSPESWGNFMQPWALELLPIPSTQFMVGVGIADVVIGIWLISAISIWIPACLATLHLAAVLITTTGGLQSTIVRDVGLFAAALALCVEARR